MSINDVSLTAGMRSNLVSLQQTTNLLNRTQDRLSSGKKVNSALDNAVSFFTASAHMNRAANLTSLKDSMGEAVQAIKAADKGLSALTSLIDQAKALGQAAKGASQNQIKLSFSNVTADDVVTIGGVDYTAATGTSLAGFDPATMFVATSDMSTTVANLAKLINTQDEVNDGGGTYDMAAVASGSTMSIQAKSASVAITQGNKDDFYTLAVQSAVALTTTDGNQVFSERKTLGEQYGDIMAQVDAIAGSSGYKGTNLLMDESLNVAFENSVLTVKGFSATASDLSLSTVASTDVTGVGAGGGVISSGTGWGWSLNIEVTSDLGKLDVAKSTLQSESSRLANNLGLITIQSDFTTNLANTLLEGADKLTLADMNEEGANMLMLQTRQSLGTTALSLSSQAAQSVLRLF